ncbi:hypothetical protein L6452_24196 [Arctium lappa]|uniref:Uncharacterized protein n=1 Tax=Arctium lappa TaxID=4217 RepID=A0ACB9A8D3_ARCLA|nr:hypothetical protein L6452_24196 [Arctium lappa]
MASSKSTKASKDTSLSRESLIFHSCNQVARLSADADYPEFNQVSIFLQRSPICHALTASTKMSKMLLGNFWLTCKYDSTTHQVSASVLSFEEHPDLSFGVDDIRSVLQIPEFNVYAPFPTHHEHDEVVAALQYVHEGKTKGSGTLLRKNMGALWNYFFSHLLYCLSHKTSGWDQSPAAITRLAHALIFMRRIDFAQVFFDSLITAISPPRNHNVALPRFISLIINHKLSTQLSADAALPEPRIKFDFPISQISKQTIFKNTKPTDSPLTSSMLSFISSPNPIWGTLDEGESERPSSSPKPSKSVVPSPPKPSRAKTVALALMTLPPTNPSVATPVISPSISVKRRSSKSPPKSRSKKLRKPSAETHTPSTNSQQSVDVELSPPGPRGSVKPSPISSKPSPQDLDVQKESPNIPSPHPLYVEVEDELVFSPDRHSASSPHSLTPGVNPVDLAQTGVSSQDMYRRLFSPTSSPTKTPSPQPSPKKSPPKRSPSPNPSPANMVGSSTQVPVTISAEFLADISDTNRQVRMLGTQFKKLRQSLREPALLESLNANNISLEELLQLAKEQNSEVVALNRDIFQCLDVMHKQIDGLRSPLSAAMDSILKEVVRLNDQNTSLTFSMAALKAASDARDQDLIHLRQQHSAQESINSEILSALQNLNRRLDSMPADLAQYCAQSLDIDITESAFTPADRHVLERIDRRVGRVSARSSVSSPTRIEGEKQTEGEKQAEGEQLRSQVHISMSQEKPSTAAETEPSASTEPSATKEKGTDHPKVVEEPEGEKLPKKDKGKAIMSPDEVVAEEKRRKDALLKKVADGAGFHLPPPKVTSLDLGLSEEEPKVAKLA